MAREPHDGPLVYAAQSKRKFYCRDAVCAFVFERGAIPINPFRVFGFFLSDRVDRELVRRANDSLVVRCDELWAFGSQLSNGVLYEVTLAATNGKPVRFWTIEDDPARIRELHVDQLQFEPEVRHLSGEGRERLLDDLRRVLDNAGEVSPAMTFDFR